MMTRTVKQARIFWGILSAINLVTFAIMTQIPGGKASCNTFIVFAVFAFCFWFFVHADKYYDKE